MNKEEFLEKYVNTPSPSGFEMLLGGQKVWMDYAKWFSHNVEIDNYGNAYAYYNKFNKDKKTVLIDAHADEIGFIVFDIDDNGFIKIARLGGSDITTTPAARVDIWVIKEDGTTKSIPGIFGHPAIHIQEKDLKIKIEDVFIDVGLSSREEVLNTGIEIGSAITMTDGFFKMDNYYCGRSLDDKIGGYINTQVLRKLKENDINLNFNLVIVNAVQEEVGLFGAKMASELIKPDVAIAIDVCHDTTSPAYSRKKQGHIVAGEGCVLMSAPAIQKNLLRILKEKAKEHDIKYQMTVSGRGTGTNADSYFTSGTPTALIKMGMRYMHTTVETVHKDDVQSAIDLLYNVIENGNIIQNLKYK
jgi:putative aminopeptidase FrvX